MGTLKHTGLTITRPPIIVDDIVRIVIRTLHTKGPKSSRVDMQDRYPPFSEIAACFLVN
jgi:hypothetical protein